MFFFSLEFFFNTLRAFDHSLIGKPETSLNWWLLSSSSKWVMDSFGILYRMQCFIRSAKHFRWVVRRFRRKYVINYHHRSWFYADVTSSLYSWTSWKPSWLTTFRVSSFLQTKQYEKLFLPLVGPYVPSPCQTNEHRKLITVHRACSSPFSFSCLFRFVNLMSTDVCAPRARWMRSKSHTKNYVPFRLIPSLNSL